MAEGATGASAWLSGYTVTPRNRGPSARPPIRSYARIPLCRGPVPVVRLTAKERILIHLADYAKYADVVEVTPEMGQEGIARAAGIYVQHVRQFLDPLLKEGLVRERTAHVKGHRRRLKVYDLTDSGRLAASRLGEEMRDEGASAVRSARPRGAPRRDTRPRPGRGRTAKRVRRTARGGAAPPGVRRSARRARRPQ